MRNDFAFSFSTWKTFNRCPRAWWISKVLFWGGWNRDDVPRPVRLAYGLTKMQTAYSLAGSVVHALAEQVVRDPGARTTEQLMAAFELRFAAGVAESARGDWRTDPKRRVNLFEHYYAHPRADEILERAKSSGLRSTMNLLDSAVVDRARRGRVLQTEVLQQFRVYGVPVWVQVDVVTEVDDLVWLDDYKTGRRHDEHRAQVMLYALFWSECRSGRGVGLDRLRLAIDYLRDGEVTVIEPTEEDLDELRASILDAASSITERLTPPEPGGVQLNLGREEDFPGVDDPAVCQDCSLLHACRGHRDLSCSTSTQHREVPHA